MIRNATHYDVAVMAEIGRLMHAEGVFSKFNYDYERVVRLISTLIELDRGIAIVATEGDKIIGGFIGSLDQHWFGNDMQAYDLALFIVPEKRQGLTAVRLIKEYIKQAKALGASQISIANSTGFEPERVKALFEYTGFKQVGYVMEHSPCNSTS